ncbi:LacI family DNA-binding transcriptional regulator [Kribbella sp. NPDC050820]|uniref:LacI family DNA-binding transcriptional regulator n=1 Tax=Kribbella sp. NPDC050820 TaxID=3155408 RepID=UPI00340A76CF
MLEEGSMAARMRDVAERAGVSMKTVSNVINNYPHITPATRARVEAAIADLDYRPNLGARSLRKGTYGVIALAIPDLANEYFATLAAAVARAARKHDVALLIEQTEGDPTAESQALTGLRDRPVDAILLWPTHPTATGAKSAPAESINGGPAAGRLVRSDAASSRPVVLLGAALAEQAADNEALAEQAVCLALEHLADGTPPAPRHLAIQRAEAAGS